VEAYQEPAGGAYSVVRRAGPGDRLAPLALPTVTVAVGDIIL
jgi:hypothetical protein